MRWWPIIKDAVPGIGWASVLAWYPNGSCAGAVAGLVRATSLPTERARSGPGCRAANRHRLH
jgi:hypothetical protein